MNFGAAETLARALLYEGYLLYPYRASSLKNRQRWAFGSLHPPAFVDSARAGDKSRMQTECLVAGAAAQVRFSVRFLQLVGTAHSDESSRHALERTIDVERLVVKDLARTPHRAECALSERDGAVLRASVTASASELAPDLFKLRVVVENETPLDRSRPLSRSDVEPHTLGSTHTLLGVESGHFISLLEPPDAFSAAAFGCENVATWPVLVGPAGSDDVMLSSPVILYDRPAVAPESPGDFFDGTEIDEMLALRVQTLTEDERREILASDPRGAAVLRRTDTLGREALERLHGAFRDVSAIPAASSARRPRPGDSVVLRPKASGDVIDLALAGEAATVTSVEVDFEGRLHCAVTIDADPGRDLGERGMPGHRFFFTPEELEIIR